MYLEPTQWKIEFYVDSRGNRVVEEYIDALPKKPRAKIRNYIRFLRELGHQIKMPHAKQVTGHKPLWELRPLPYRLLYFAHTEHRFIILHAFRKKGQKLKRKDIELAERRMAEVKAREE